MATTGLVDGGSWSSCDFSTNWRIAAGCLQRNIVFESSSEDSPVDAPSLDSSNDTSTHVVLKPQSADSGPCEIKIRFSQKYEIRQIYVRSTARVYEVYYLQSWKSDSRYLCTARCSIAERDEQVLQAFDTEESAESTGNSSLELKEDKLSVEGNTGSSDDDWVEVKVLDSSLQHRINSLSNQKSSIRGRDIQDFYEATAEISDLDPCTSVTLRFLSLQNKSCVFVDEVYVFADPVSAIEHEDQSQDVKGSAGSSLMAMLVPTLLRLSKSGMNQIQGQQASSDLRKSNEIESQSKATDLTDITNHQGEKGSDYQVHLNLKSVGGFMTGQAGSQLCNQILDGGKSEDSIEKKDRKSEDTLGKNDSSYDHIEKVLKQLMSRVARVEEICLRIEENMLKPLNSMEMRIHQVEQQLERLVNNSRCSILPPCTRISAPSFSCTSNSSSVHDEGHDYQPCRAPETEEKEMTRGDLSSAPNGISRSANVPHLLPSLVVTAPDFSCEDDLDDNGLKPLNISPRESKKKSLIDDVLAASLSGFLTASTSHLSDFKKTPSCCNGTSEVIIDEVSSENVQAVARGVDVTNNINAKEPSRYTQVLTVMAPEFTSEENVGEELLNYEEVGCIAVLNCASKISPSSNNVTLKGTGNGCSTVTSDLPHMNSASLWSGQASTPSTVASAIFAESNSQISDDVLGSTFSESHVLERNNTCNTMVTNLDETEDSISIDVCQTILEFDQREPVTSLLPEQIGEFEQLPGDETDGCPISAGIVGGVTESAAAEVRTEILQNLSKSSGASLVDFGIPILDVKFNPYEDCRIQLPLESLLDDAINLNVEADPPDENVVKNTYTRETNLIDIYEEEETGDDALTSKSHVIGLGVSSVEENDVDDSYSTCKRDAVVSLI